jgi:hypothetical protein
MRRRSMWEDREWPGQRRRRGGIRLLSEQVKIMMGVWWNDRLFILPEGIRLMSQAPKDTRTPAEKARDTAGIIGSLMHEGYVPNPEDEAIYQMAERGEITTDEVIAIFRERALARQRRALAHKRPRPR